MLSRFLSISQGTKSMNLLFWLDVLPSVKMVGSCGKEEEDGLCRSVGASVC